MQTVRFLTELDVRIHPCPPPGVDRRKCFQLRSPLIVQIGDSWLLNIPPAFYSDGGSVPTVMWSLLRIHPLDPHFARSFFLHDFVYAVGWKDRQACDELLLSGSIFDGAPEVKRELVYNGVRIGGWVAWGRYRRKSTLELQKSINSLKREEPMFALTVSNWARNLDGLS